MYSPPGFIDSEDGDRNIACGGWREQVEDEGSGLTPLGPTGSNRHSRLVADVRDAYRDYFNSAPGEVSWQYNHMRRTY